MRWLFSKSDHELYLEGEILRLREELAELKEDERKLLDRVLILTTGAPLVIPPAAPDPEADTSDSKKGSGSSPSTSTSASVPPPFSTTRPLQALYDEMEADSFQADALAQGYTDEVVEGASTINAHEADTEEEARRKKGARRNLEVLVAKAKSEYERRMPPSPDA